MARRVVMIRELPCRTARRVMRRLWEGWGYSSRPCLDREARQGWVVVEFWVHAPTARSDILASYEWELDDALLSRRVRAKFNRTGAHIES
jgi:hypothetical protein